MAFGEHTSKSIIGTKSRELLGKRIVLCVTGSVAANRSPDIARELMRLGGNVYVVMNEDAGARCPS
jgi:phosphopantothenoylcysteine decarboxylase/phosphopantothenate--cysteine ligase